MPEYPICGDCGPATLPAQSFDDCPTEVNESEIEDIFYAKLDAADFDDWTDPTEWATRLSQTVTTTGDEIRRLSVIGDKPGPTPNKKQISKQREITLDRTHTLNFDVDETNDINYEAMRAMQCGGKYKWWYKTRGQKLYGGNSGVKATVDTFDVLARGDESEKFQYTLTWRDKFDPPRATSPI